MIPIENFEAQSMNGNFVPIIPGGGNINLTYHNRKEYVDKALQFRLHELDRQVSELILDASSTIAYVTKLSSWTNSQMVRDGSLWINLNKPFTRPHDLVVTLSLQHTIHLTISKVDLVRLTNFFCIVYPFFCCVWLIGCSHSWRNVHDCPCSPSFPLHREDVGECSVWRWRRGPTDAKESCEVMITSRIFKSILCGGSICLSPSFHIPFSLFSILLKQGCNTFKQGCMP